MNDSDKDLKEEYNRWHSTGCRSRGLERTYFRNTHFSNLVLDLLGVEKRYRGKKKKILDVACGQSLFLKHAKRRRLDICGIDISDVAIEEAKKLVKGNFLVGNAENLPYQDNSFDYVTCLGSLEHFTHPDSGVKEIVRVLEKDGRSLIYVPNLMFLGHIFMTWRYGIMPSEGDQSFSETFYTYQGWEKLLEDNGLKVVFAKKYNHIFGTKKAPKVVVWFWEKFLRPFVPFNLSYCFLFVCEKKRKT